jgi:hypothetical protein
VLPKDLRFVAQQFQLLYEIREVLDRLFRVAVDQGVHPRLVVVVVVVGSLIGHWLVGWWVGWLVGGLVGWWVGWLVGWLVH